MQLIDLLKKVKSRYPMIWRLIELCNGYMLTKLASYKLNAIRKKIITYPIGQSITARLALINNIEEVVDFLKGLSQAERAFFNPFPFTLRSIYHVVSCGTYQVYLVRNNQNNELIGLFFLRFFLNRQCFLGFVVKNEYRGRGIGEKMIDAMVRGVQGSGFTLLSTVCAENKASLRAHLAGGQFEIIETLPTNEIVLKMKEQL